MYKCFCLSLTEGTFLAINESTFFRKLLVDSLLCKKITIEGYKFCALCTLKGSLVRGFPVDRIVNILEPILLA